MFHNRLTLSILMILCLLAAATPVAHSQAVALHPASVLAAPALLPDLPTWITEGALVGEEYGYSVHTAGDVNGDGYADILVGSPFYDNGVYREGAVFAYYGSTDGLETTPDWVNGSTLLASRYGCSVSTAGDVDKDGYDDVIIGAYRYNDGEPEEGAAYLYLGSADGLVLTPTWMIEGNLIGAQLGYAVSDAGDLNGDGFADVVVGVRWFVNEEVNEGRAMVFYGSPTGLKTSADWFYEMDQTGAGFGSAVGGAGDVNGDGYDDLIVGAPNYDGMHINSGAAFVFLGSETGLSDSYEWQAEGLLAEDWFGISVDGAGDVNADGYADVIVGASYYDAQVTDEGGAFIFFGSENGLSHEPDWSWASSQTGSQLGASVAGVGDVNGDEVDDFMLGAPMYTNDQQAEGGIFVFYGRETGLSTHFDWRNFGNKADTMFGFSVAPAGDVDADGYADLLVGAPEYRVNRILVGRAYVYNGEQGFAGWITYIPLVTNGILAK